MLLTCAHMIIPDVAAEGHVVLEIPTAHNLSSKGGTANNWAARRDQHMLTDAKEMRTYSS